MPHSTFPSEIWVHLAVKTIEEGWGKGPWSAGLPRPPYTWKSLPLGPQPPLEWTGLVRSRETRVSIITLWKMVHLTPWPAVSSLSSTGGPVRCLWANQLPFCASVSLTKKIRISFFGHALGVRKFPGQGLNLHHSSDNASSLTHWTTRELPPNADVYTTSFSFLGKLPRSWQNSKNVLNALAKMGLSQCWREVLSSIQERRISIP